MATYNFDDCFKQKKLIEDFVKYLIEEEVEADYYHNDNYDLITTWVKKKNNRRDLQNYIIHNCPDMELIKYLVEMNEEFDGTLLDCLFNCIKNKKNDWDISRETLYQLVIETRLKMCWTECIDKLIEIENTDKVKTNSPEKTTIENLTNYLKYNTENLDNDCLCIYWDCRFDKEKEEFINKELNDLMSNEIYYNPRGLEEKASFMWLEELKKYFNYKLGEKLYILTKSNADGYFNAWKVNEEEWYDMYIDEEGYINVNHFVYPFDYSLENGYSHSSVKIYVKPNSIYNDNIYKQNKK